MLILEGSSGVKQRPDFVRPFGMLTSLPFMLCAMKSSEEPQEELGQWGEWLDLN